MVLSLIGLLSLMKVLHLSSLERGCLSLQAAVHCRVRLSKAEGLV